MVAGSPWSCPYFSVCAAKLETQNEGVNLLGSATNGRRVIRCLERDGVGPGGKEMMQMASSNLRIAGALTVLIILLAAPAALGGLLLPGLYRETEWVVPQVRGQDLVTLLALPFLAAAMRGAQRGSARATMMWIGLLGYIFYTYTGASFSYHFNYFFLLYVALFSLSVFALIATMTGIDAVDIHSHFDATTPRRAVAGYLAFVGILLIVLWLGQIIPFFTTGALPELIVRAETPTNFVYVLDLGLVVPLAFLAAVWLWRGEIWGDVLAGAILIKAATMGLALLSMTGFAWRAGQPIAPELAVVWVVIAGGSLGMIAWFLHHCRAGRLAHAVKHAEKSSSPQRAQSTRRKVRGK